MKREMLNYQALKIFLVVFIITHECIGTNILLHVDSSSSFQVAAHLGTEHHEVMMTTEEGLGCLEEVIYQLESYDISSIRPSVGKILSNNHYSSFGRLYYYIKSYYSFYFKVPFSRT